MIKKKQMLTEQGHPQPVVPVPVSSTTATLETVTPAEEYTTPATPSSEIEHKYVPMSVASSIQPVSNLNLINAAATAAAINGTSGHLAPPTPPNHAHSPVDRKPIMPPTTLPHSSFQTFQSNLFAGVAGFDESFFSAATQGKQEYTPMAAPLDVAKHTGVPSFKPETSAYYPMSHAMSHNHLATASSVVVPQLSSAYALSVGAAAAGAVENAVNGAHGADIHESQPPYMGPYGTIGLNEAMYISAPSVHQSQNGLMNTGLPANSMMAHYSGLGSNQIHGANNTVMPSASAEYDTDPRELESFAERFKQRRIKLGVTQADVGQALGKLKIPGVGSLSQSTICRFESLTLSHNNMVALKPILQAWLERAENAAKAKKEVDGYNGNEKKRKRTSIAAPEKRSLEAYFTVQPRPSSEKIAAIAEKLDLKKNVVRVWFCNQRQKQKRMKFSAYNQEMDTE